LSSDEVGRFTEALDRRLSLITFLDLFYEENRSRDELCEQLFWRKNSTLIHREAHGDPNAYALFRVEEVPAKCPYPAHGHVDTVSFLEDTMWEIDKLSARWIYFHGLMEAASRDDGRLKEVNEMFDNLYNQYKEKLLYALLKLKPAVRKDLIAKVRGVEYFRKFYDDEVWDLLTKSKVEVKIVLSVEEALELYRKYGPKWRDEARRMIAEGVG